MREWLVISALSVSLCACGSPDAPSSELAAPSPELSADVHHGAVAFAPDARPFGRSMTSWNKRWWRWELSIPTAQNPSLDETGANCDEGQGGRVWFLGSLFRSGSVTRECTIPPNRALLVNLSSLLNDFPCPDTSFHPAPGQTLEEFLTEGATQFQDLVNALNLTVDGQVVNNLFDYRVVTPLFHFRGDLSLKSSIDGCITGTRQPAVSDAFLVMLKPLAAGDHVVTFGAGNSRGTVTQLTYNIHVRRGHGHHVMAAAEAGGPDDD